MKAGFVKAYKLRRAVGEEARIHSNGEWQLRFRDGNARDLAHKRLKLEEWLCYKKSADDEILYTFINDSTEVGEVLVALEAAGITRNEIEVEASTHRIVGQVADEPLAK